MRNITRSLAVAAASVIALGALAAAPAGTRNDGRRAVKLEQTTEVLGTSVPAGHYDLSWTREPGSENVTLAVTQGKKVFASGKGVWASGERPYPHEALVYRKASGASSELAEIRFRGSADRIVVAAHDDTTAPNGTDR